MEKTDVLDGIEYHRRAHFPENDHILKSTQHSSKKETINKVHNQNFANSTNSLMFFFKAPFPHILDCV